MEFKLWLEIVELREPIKVTRQNVIKDRGTNVARRIIQYSYQTKLGNVVKLQFEPKGNDEYGVIFYVNDVLYDYASKLMGTHRDTEILPTVFSLLKKKAKKLKAKQLVFHAISSDNDIKIFRNLNFDPNESLTLLNDLERQIKNYQIKMIEPKASVFLRLGIPVPPARPDVNKESWLSWINNVKKAINDKSPIDNYLNELKSVSLPFDLSKLIASLQRLSNVIDSHSERGFHRNSNRRANIYSRILHKNFTDEWNIHMNGNNFVLSSKYYSSPNSA